MSKVTVKAAITQALKTPKGHAQVSKAEAEAITKAALTEPQGPSHVTADEAKLLDHLLHGDTFDGAPKYQLTAPAKQVLESFAASQGLPIGANADAMKSKVEGVLANADLGAPLAKAPSTSSLLKLPLSDSTREAFYNPTDATFYLRTATKTAGQPKVVSYYGPFSVNAQPPAKLDAAQLAAKVAELGKDYLFPSETDVALHFLTGPKDATVDEAGIRSAFTAQHDALASSMFGTTEPTGLAPKYCEEVPAEDFFNRYGVPYDPSDPSIVNNCKHFADVAAALKANLTDIHVYRFSEGKPGDNIHAPGEVSIFIAGRAASGELVSVMTAAVQT